MKTIAPAALVALLLAGCAGEPPSLYLGDQVDRIVVAPDSDKLAGVNAESGIVSFWSLPAGKLAWKTQDPAAEASTSCLAFTDETTIVTGGSDFLRLWRVTDGTPIGGTIDDIHERVFAIAVSPRIDAAGLASAIELLETGKKPRRIEWSTERHEVRAIAISPDGARLAAGDDRGLVQIFTVADGSLVAKLEGHKGAVTGVVFASWGEQLLTSSEDATVCIWSLEAKKALRVIGHPGSVTAIACSKEGDFATACEDGKVRVFSPRGDLERTLRADSGVSSVAFVPSTGAIVAAGAGKRREVLLWEKRAQ